MLSQGRDANNIQVISSATLQKVKPRSYRVVADPAVELTDERTSESQVCIFWLPGS